jgi:hypothetical protein
MKILFRTELLVSLIINIKFSHISALHLEHVWFALLCLLPHNTANFIPLALFVSL